MTISTLNQSFIHILRYFVTFNIIINFMILLLLLFLLLLFHFDKRKLIQVNKHLIIFCFNVQTLMPTTTSTTTTTTTTIRSNYRISCLQFIINIV